MHVSVIFGRLSSFVVTITNWKSDDVPRQFGLACDDRLIVVCDTLCATQKKRFSNGVGSSRSMVFRQFLPRRSQAFKSAELVEVVHIHRQVPTKDSVHRPSLSIISQRVLCPFPLSLSRSASPSLSPSLPPPPPLPRSPPHLSPISSPPLSRFSFSLSHRHPSLLLSLTSHSVTQMSCKSPTFKMQVPRFHVVTKTGA